MSHYHAYRVNIYELYDDGKLIFTGDRFKCAKVIGININKLTRYETHNGKKILNRYTLKPIGKEQRLNLIDTKIIPNTKKIDKQNKNKTMEYLLKHLREYGNTVLNNNPERYLKALRENGLDCTYRKVLEDGVKQKRYFYIIEVK